MKIEMGDALLQAMVDPEIVEIMRNADGLLWQDRLGEMSVMGAMSDANALSLIFSVADSLGTVANRENPIVEGELLIDGSRFEGVIPPVTPAPTFAIRKRALQVFTLQDYVDQGILEESQSRCLAKAVRQRRNILVAGGTGSGKTTLVNALIHQVVVEHPDDRIVIIEDTQELQCAAKNAVLLRTSEHVDMQRLLRATLRLRPDRILVGEVRGPEALSMVKSWNTGHPGGLATLHASSASLALTRLTQLIREATTSDDVEEVVSQTVDIVVFITKTKGRRVVSELVEVASQASAKEWNIEPLIETR